MGFSFFKSKKVGPFRINASKSGVGVSFGIKGARVNFSPRGTFVNVGANGIYYRKKISNKSNEKKAKHEDEIDVVYDSSSGGEEIGTINIDQLSDIDSQELIEEIRRKAKKISLLNWFGILPIILILFTLCTAEESVLVDKEKIETVKTLEITGSKVNVRDAPSSNGNILYTTSVGQSYEIVESDNSSWIGVKQKGIDTTTVYIHSSLASITDSSFVVKYQELGVEPKDNSNTILLLLPFFIGWLVLFYYLDKKRKSIELYYAFDDVTKELFNNMIRGFGELKKVQRVWHYSYKKNVQDSKYNAGANQMVSRHKVKGISLDSLPMKHFKSNVSIPCVELSKTKLYFLPERLLIQIGNKYGSLKYNQIQFDSSTSRFVEDQKVMRDANVVGRTYKYVNKSGGPDKRFKDNYEIPICAYSQYDFTSQNGLSEVIVTSKMGGMDDLINALCEIQNYEEILENSPNFG